MNPVESASRTDTAAFLHAVLEQSADMIVVTDEGGVVMWTSRAVERTFGYANEDLVSRNFLEFVHPDEVASVAESLQTTVSRPESADPLEIRFVRSDGSWVICEVIGVNRFDDPVVHGMVWHARDVSNRLELQRQYRRLFEASPTPTFLGRPTEVGVVANRAFADLIGYTPEELRMKSAADLLVTADVSRAQRFERTMAEGSFRVARGDVTMVRSNDKQFQAEVAVSPLTDENGMMFITTVYDVTEWRDAVRDNANAEVEQRRASEQLLDQERRLAFEVAERERAELETRLEQAMRLESVGRLSVGLAHDFNNLVGVILNYTAVLERNDFLDGDGLQDVAAISAAAETAAGLATSLLKFGEVGSGPSAVIDLRDVATRVEPLVRASLRAGQSCEFKLCAEAAFVRVDRGQLEQVFMNLALNARDAISDDGHIEIDIRHCRDIAGDDAVLIDVVDDGAGMTDDVRKRAFDPFYTTKPTGQGTGLGLAVVHGIVTNHRGEVRLDSTHGKGTRVSILIPAAMGER